MKLEKKHYIWGGIILALILIYIFRNQLMNLFGMGTSSSAKRAMNNIPANYLSSLSAKEKDILSTLYSNINSAGTGSMKNQYFIQSLVTKANDQLRSAGSNLSISMSAKGEFGTKPCQAGENGWTINIGIFTFRHCKRD